MLIYVACWPLLAYLAGNLIPAIGSGDLSKVSNIIIKSLFVFLIQKTAQFGQDVFIAKPSLEISEVIKKSARVLGLARTARNRITTIPKGINC